MGETDAQQQQQQQQEQEGGAAAPPAAKQRVISKEEMAKHNTEDDCWIAVHGKVYDITKFLPDHPGGPEVITNIAGSQAASPTNQSSDPPTRHTHKHTLHPRCVCVCVCVCRSGHERGV